MSALFADLRMRGKARHGKADSAASAAYSPWPRRPRTTLLYNADDIARQFHT